MDVPARGAQGRGARLRELREPVSFVVGRTSAISVVHAPQPDPLATSRKKTVGLVKGLHQGGRRTEKYMKRPELRWAAHQVVSIGGEGHCE